MNIANIIIIVIILVIIYIVLTRTILKTNIVYDKVLDANDENPDFTTVTSNENTFIAKNSVRKNLIPNDVLNDNSTSNFMISVWFYIDMWTPGSEKNILFIGNNEGNTTPSELLASPMTGVSDQQCAEATSIGNKVFSIVLGDYDNDLFIDIKTVKSAGEQDCTSPKEFFTRYKIENIPIQKWNCLTISIDTLLLDVYLDGRLYSSFVLPGVYDPDVGTGQGNNHIYLGNLVRSRAGAAAGTNAQGTTGFIGFITRIRWESNAINTQDAMNIYREGINKSLLNSIFNKYSLKVSFLEYNKEKGSFSI